MSVLLVEHHMDLVMSVCDRIVVLNFGRVIAQGAPDAIRANPEVATAYLGDVVQATSAPRDGGDNA
jgi:branched-chain amino acid transport system ATP-binding protein